MVSLPYHSDVGTLLKAKDSSFLSFFSGFQPPNIAVHCAVVYVGIVILVVKTEKKATCWREREENKILTAAQPVCCCVVRSCLTGAH